MPNHAGVLQSRFFPAKLEAEGDDAIFNTLLVRFKLQPVQWKKAIHFVQGLGEHHPQQRGDFKPVLLAVL